MCISLKPRQLEILKCLVMSSTPLDVSYFIDRFHKSARTIRYDIQELKDVLAIYEVEIKYIIKKGYYIPVNEKASCSQFFVGQELDSKQNFIHQDVEERYQKIFLYFLVQRQPVSADHVASMFYVSRSTLTRTLEKMKLHFHEKFMIDGKTAIGYQLIGDEYLIRKHASEILAERFKGSYTAEDWFILLPDECKGWITLDQIIEISKFIKQMNAKYNIWISNASFLNVLSYCIVRCIRLQLGATQKSHMLCEEHIYIEELLQKLSPYSLGRTQVELNWLCEVLSDNGVFVQESLLDDRVLKKILLSVMAYIERQHGQDAFDLAHLYNDLYEHLNNFLNLSVCGKQEEDNSYILNEVKKHYYKYYEIAQACAQIIEAEANLPFNITEICYLAVYLYKNSVHSEDKHKNVYVVCATGKGLSHLLTLRIKNVFPTLNVVGQVSPYQVSRASDLNNVDFVISTIPIKDSMVPVIKISAILASDDIQRINDFMEYGKLVDEIPMNQNSETSFSSKSNLYELTTTSFHANKESIAQSSQLLSQLILSLLEYISKFPKNRQLGKDATLGLIIHMSMAVTRWLDPSLTKEVSEDFEKEYIRIKQEDSQIFALMENFFELVEETLQVHMNVAEKVAFFLYIREDER